MRSRAWVPDITRAIPSFLGRLRDNLDQATAHTVARRIDKNWAQHDRRKIESLLAR